MSTGDFPSPLRHFLAQLDELRSGDILDMDQVGRLLVELAADEEYLGPLIAEMPSESAGQCRCLSDANYRFVTGQPWMHDAGYASVGRFI